MIKVKLKDKQRTILLVAETGNSMREFSNKIGISQPYLSQVLNGKANPSTTIAYKIANGLGLEIKDIFLIEVIENINQKKVGS